MNLEKLLKLYDYNLPPELIAQEPARPRDRARVLVYNRNSKKISFDVFSELGKYLPKNSVLVFNKTKVVPARLELRKPTGGKVEVLYIGHDKKFIKVIANRRLSLGSTITLPDTYIIHGRELYKYKFAVEKVSGQFYFLKPSFPVGQVTSVLEKYGKTPLPPYIKHSKLTETQKRKEYQSIFAKAGLSVAAPTASLHFTKNLIAKLKKQGIEVKFVTLNVNLGTFAPLKEGNLKSGKLHSETYRIDKQTAAYLNKAKKENKNIIAVGTTVVRTLESAAKNHRLVKLEGSTDLFIQPSYKFQIVDSLITNFHVPKSSLLMLVSALTGRKELLDIYQKAIKKRFRFFSFGDGMLVI